MPISRAEVVLQGRDATAAAFRSVIRNAETAQRRISSAFRGAFALLGGGAAFTGLHRFITTSIKAGDEISKFAQKSGLGSRGASELAHAARMADLDLGQLAAGVRALQKNLSEAASGSESAQDKFRQLGIDWKFLKSLAPEQQLEEIANVLASIGDPADRSRVAVDLLGKSGADLLPLFSQGAAGIRKAREEAVQLGKSFSDQQLRQFEEADKALKKLSASSSSLGDTLALKTAPALTAFYDSLRLAFGGGTQIELLKREIRGLEIRIPQLQFVPDEQVKAMERLVSARRELARLEQGLGTGIRGGRGMGFGRTFVPEITDPNAGKEQEKAREKIEEVIASVRQQIATYKQGSVATLSYRIAHGDLAKALAEVRDGAGPLRAELKAVTAELEAQAKAAETAKARAEIEGLIASLEQEIATLDKGAVETVEYQIASGDLAATFKILGAEGQGLAKTLVNVTSRHSDAKEAAEAHADAERRALQVVEQTRTPYEVMQQQIQELDRLREEFPDLIDPETHKRRMEQIEDDFERATNSMSVFWDQGMRNMESHAADFFFDPFEKGLKGLLRGFVDVVRRMIAEAAAARLFETLFDGPSGNRGSGFLGALFGGLGSRVGGSGGGGGGLKLPPGSVPTFPGYATGGYMAPGSMALVGERGPELAMAGRQGATIVPLLKDQAMAAPYVDARSTISVTMNNPTVDAVQEFAKQFPTILDRRDEQLELKIVSRLQRGIYDRRR